MVLQGQFRKTERCACRLWRDSLNYRFFPVMETVGIGDSTGLQYADEQAVLKNFLKDNIESKNPATRIAAIDRLDDQIQEHQEKLIKVALDDIDDGVRVAAIEKLSDPATLTQLSCTPGDTADLTQPVRESARQRLMALLAEPDRLSDDTVNQLLATGPRDLHVMVACHSCIDVIRDTVIMQLSAQQELASVITQSRFHAARDLAAERLSDEHLMAACAATIKTRDKVVARRLQDRIDSIRAATRHAEAHQEVVKQLIISMKTLSESVWSPQYAGRFTATSERWSKLNPVPSEEQKERFAPYFELCRQKVEDHKNQQQAEIFCQQASQQLLDLTNEFKKIPLADLGAAISQFRRQAVDINASWKVSVAIAKPDETSAQTYETRRDVVQQLIREGEGLVAANTKVEQAEQLSVAELTNLVSAIKAVVGEDSAKKAMNTDDCQSRADANALLLTLTSRQKQKHNEDEAKIKSIQKQLGGLSAAIGDGKWSPANSLYARVDKKISRLDNGREKQMLADRLLKQKKKLDELADWHDFASKPKLEVLCQQMEEVPALGLSPLDQAARIKQLQEEWKSIGPSRCANELWPRFKTAGDTAYEPVAAFYSAKKDERESRLKNKQLVCERLTQYLGTVDWDSVDWKTVEKILRIAKKEWRDNRVSDRKPDKALEQKFTDLVETFNEKLNAQYDANAASKEELIEKIKKLSDADINQHTVNQTKRLQNSWKQTGIMRRRQDQELWETFNGHCREIYKQHRDTEKQKTESGLEHVRKARDLIRSIKQLCKAGEPDEKSFTAMQDQFNALPEFPDKDRKFLFRDFNQASEQFNRLKEQSSARAAKAELVELQRRSFVCGQLESLITPDSSDDSLVGQRMDELLNEWDETTVILPKKWLTQIEKRKSAALAHIKNSTCFDFSEGDKARRLVCIRAEIISGNDTPAEDKQARMAYQLDQLQQGITSSDLTDTARKLQELSVEWMSLPPSHPDDRDQLESRFQAALQK